MDLSITVNTNDQIVEIDPQTLDEFIQQNGIAKLRKLFFVDSVERWLGPIRDWVVECFNENKTRFVCSQEIQKVAPRFLEPPLPLWICMLLGVCDMEIPEVIKESHQDYRFKERQIRSWQGRDWGIPQEIYSDMHRDNKNQKKLIKVEKSNCLENQSSKSTDIC